MKRLIAIMMIVIISMFSFAGCGEADNAAREAGELVTDASESVSKAASDMMDNTDGDIDDNSDDGNISDN